MNAFNKCVFVLSIVLALVHVSVALVDFLFSEYTNEMIVFIKKLLEPLRDDIHTSVFVGYVGNDLSVFWGAVYLLIRFYFSIKIFKIEGFLKFFFFDFNTFSYIFNFNKRVDFFHSNFLLPACFLSG